MTELALEALYRVTSAALKISRPDAESAFGWKAPTQSSEYSARIVWVPGDPQGLIGDIGAASQTIELPDAPLATLGEQFTVYIHARTRDEKKPNDDLLNYGAARRLFDAWLVAFADSTFAVGTGSRATVGKLAWETSKKELPLGRTLRALCTVQAAVTRTSGDQNLATNPESDFVGSVLDRDETQHVKRSDTP